MTKTYEKFKEWMVGQTVEHVVGGKGVLIEPLPNGDWRGDVSVKYENGGVFGAKLRLLKFLEENKPIPWEVGQIVWCLFAGKGKVISVDEGNFDPVQVEFDDGGYMTYGYDGLKSGYEFRCLFFSEPQIIANTMPPKKPFVPALKEGDAVVLSTGDREFIATVEREEEDEVYIKQQVSGLRYPKRCIKVYKLGEEIKFKEN